MERGQNVGPYKQYQLRNLLLRPHEVSSGGIFDAGILKVAHHPLG